MIQRVQIVRSTGNYFKKGQFGYVVATDKRGGCCLLDRDWAESAPGEPAYMVSKTKDMRGGALWFSGDGIRFTARKR